MQRTAHRPHASPTALAAVAALLALVAPTGASAAEEIFLRLDGIRGGALSARHEGEIVLTAYSQTFSNTLNPAGGSGGGAGVGKPSCGGITVVKQIDRASPLLLAHVATGQRVASGDIAFANTAAPGAPISYAVRLQDVVITSVEQTDRGPGSISERVTLAARSYRYTYTPVLPNGQQGAAVSFGFDCATNTTF